MVKTATTQLGYRDASFQPHAAYSLGIHIEDGTHVCAANVDHAFIERFIGGLGMGCIDVSQFSLFPWIP